MATTKAKDAPTESKQEAPTDQKVKLVSKKTGKPQIMSQEDAKLHMKLHGRHFTNKGPVEEFTPEEAKEPGTQQALPQGSNPASENEAAATSNQ
jgi:hypothetical protein